MDINHPKDTTPMAGRLLRGETVVWSGAPEQGVLLTGRDALLIPFSLLWGGFAIFWEVMALRGHAPFPFALFGVPFVLVGLFLVFGRFLVDSWLRARTSYAVTTHRILIVRSGPWPSFTSLKLDRLPETTVLEQGNGRGTIRFGRTVSLMQNNMGFSWIAALDPTPQFFRIADVHRVFADIQNRSIGDTPASSSERA